MEIGKDVLAHFNKAVANKRKKDDWVKSQEHIADQFPNLPEIWEALQEPKQEKAKK